jgi:uncharacterized protein (TIGR02391 family)
MRLVDLIPNADVLFALEPDELGLRMLPVLAEWHARTPRYQSAQLGLQAFLDATLGSVTLGGQARPSGQYPSERRAEIELAIREAWTWLEGSALLIKAPGYGEPNLVRQLSRRAQQLASEPNPRRVLSARRLSKDTLYPTIREDVWALYHRGKYDPAVFEAMKAVEVAVRAAAGLTAADLGTNLIRKAFDVENGPLTDKAAEQGERQARSDLFAGAIGSYKNPHSHRNVDLDDPDEAAEIIMLANHLLRIIDARVVGSSSSSRRSPK